MWKHLLQSVRNVVLKENKDINHQINFANERVKSFMDFLDQIVIALGIEWWDGEFPIEQVLEKIKNARW